MNNIDPVISVIIPCYNKEYFIEETLKSVLNQTYIKAILEIIVVDDGSKDNTAQIVKRMAADHPAILYIYQENGGVSAARNTGINMCRAPFIAFLDGDDLWESDKIEIHCNYINLYPETGLFYTNFYRFLYQQNKIIAVKVIPYQHNEQNLLFKFVAKGAPVIPSTVLIKKECFDKVGLFDTSLKHGGEDIDMWLRIATHYSFQHINDFLIKKRELTDSLGANTFENAKGYKIALDKLQQSIPAIAPYRRKRDALIQYKVGLYFFKNGENSKALTEVNQAFKKDLKLIKAYVLWVAIVFNQLLGLKILDKYLK